MMRTLSPMPSLGRRDSASSMGSVRSTVSILRLGSPNHLMAQPPVQIERMRTASPQAPSNLSDVWVEPNFLTLGSPSGSPMVMPPYTPPAEPANVGEETSRTKSIALNAFGAVVAIGIIAGFFYGLYAFIRGRKA